MKKVILYIAMSLDGYIADVDGGVDWLRGDGSDEDNPGSYPDFYESIDTIIIGNSTYHQVSTELFPDSWIYEGKKCYIITHAKLESGSDIIFTDQNLTSLIGELKNQEGKDIWICGGASIVNQLLDLDLIDRFCISVIPTILGNGIRLFSEHKTDVQLKFISTKSYNGITDLVYDRKE